MRGTYSYVHTKGKGTPVKRVFVLLEVEIAEVGHKAYPTVESSMFVPKTYSI